MASNAVAAAPPYPLIVAHCPGAMALAKKPRFAPGLPLYIREEKLIGNEGEPFNEILCVLLRFVLPKTLPVSCMFRKSVGILAHGPHTNIHILTDFSGSNARGKPVKVVTLLKSVPLKDNSPSKASLGIETTVEAVSGEKIHRSEAVAASAALSPYCSTLLHGLWVWRGLGWRALEIPNIAPVQGFK